MAFIVFFLVQKMTIPSGGKRGQSFIVQVSLVSLNRRSATRRLRNRYSTCPLSVRSVRPCPFLRRGSHSGFSQDFRTLGTGRIWWRILPHRGQVRCLHPRYSTCRYSTC